MKWVKIPLIFFGLLVFFVTFYDVFAESKLFSIYFQERLNIVEFKGDGGTEQQRVLVKTGYLTVYNRILASIIRLEYLADKIKVRLAAVGDDFEGKGIAEQNLEEAYVLLISARTSLTKTIEDVENIFLMGNAAESFKVVEKSIEEDVLNNLREAHKILVETVVILEENTLQ